MEELKTLSQTVLDGGTPQGEVLPYSLAFNLFLHNSPLQANSYCEEEMKMVNETRKIMGLPDLRFTATCVRCRSPSDGGAQNPVADSARRRHAPR